MPAVVPLRVPLGVQFGCLNAPAQGYSSSCRVLLKPYPQSESTPSIVDNQLKQFAQSSQLAGGNASYVEDLYEQYLVSPDSVDPKWKTYFDGFKGREAGDIPHSAVISHIADAAKDALKAGTGTGAGDERERNVGRLITAYARAATWTPALIRWAWPRRSTRPTWAWRSTACPMPTSTASSAPAASAASRA